MPLAEEVRAGTRLAVARALTVVERAGPDAEALLRCLAPHAGRGHVVGVTGSPGVGKSTLVDGLALSARAAGQKVGIVAVDPSSPFSGGAILGDRIRMQDATMDPGVFMRSLANRGQSGGLARAAAGSIEVLDAAGFDVIFVETVGAGQSEIDIMRLAATTVVVLAPGLGDDIQAIKAGILEIADIFVVNKADREGAEHTVRELRAMLHLAAATPAWAPPILKTTAERREGLDPVMAALSDHRAFLQSEGALGDRRRQRLLALVRDRFLDQALARFRDWEASPAAAGVLDAVAAGERDAEDAARRIWSPV